MELNQLKKKYNNFIERYKGKMNSRNRLLNAIEYKKTDRVPISTYELCGCNSKSFENIEPSYKQLMNYIREKTDCIAMWNLASNELFAGTSYKAQINKSIVKNNKMTTITNTLQCESNKLTQILKINENIVTTWKVKHWCETIEEVDALLSIPYETVTYDASDYQRISKEVSNNGIIMSTVHDTLCVAAELMNFGDFTVWAMTERTHFKKTLNLLHERIMKNLEKELQTQSVDLYRIVGSEYCTIPYLPPELFSEYVSPYVREITELIHSYGCKVRLHSHGKIKDNIKEILTLGVDAIDPVEDYPDGNTSLKEIKRHFEGRVSVFGNIQLKMLENGDVKEVRDYVKYAMDSAKEGGGFVIMPTASPINIPLNKKTIDNYYEFIDTALEFGKY